MKKSCITYHNKKIFKVVQHFTNKQHRLYIFIGPAKQNIQTILKKIEKDGFNKLNRDDENILAKQYGPNYRDLFGPVLPASTHFIYTFIDMNDNIKDLKRKLFVHIKKITKQNIHPHLQYLWVKNSKTTPLMVRSMIRNIYRMRTTIKKKDLISKLSIINPGIKPNIKDNNISIKSFTNNHDLIDIIHTKETILGYEVSSFIMANPLLYKKDISIDTRAFNKQHNKILSYYGDFENDTIHLISKNDFKNDYPNIKKHYWPYINDTNPEPSKQTIEKYYEMIHENETFIDVITNMKESLTQDAEKEVKYTDCNKICSFTDCEFINLEKGRESLVIKVYPNNDIDVNLDSIVSNFKLSKDVPYINYKSKNITKIYNMKDDSIIKKISKLHLLSFKHTYIHDEKKNIIRLTNSYNGLSFKILLKEIMSVPVFFTLNIYPNSKLEILFYNSYLGKKIKKKNIHIKIKR